MTSRLQFTPGREGLVYATGYSSDDKLQGPFKIGETGRSGGCRLRGEKAFIDPRRALCVRGQWQFGDRVWAEQQVHLALSKYRIVRTPGAEAGEEWFDCSFELIERAIDEVYRRQEVPFKAMLRSISGSGRGCVSLDQACGTNSALNALLRYRMRSNRTLGDLVHDALYAPVENSKIISELQNLGMHCLPVEKLVVFRRSTTLIDQFLKQLGFHQGSKHLGRIVGFDHDRNPISVKDLKVRCRGFDIQQLFS